MGDLFNPTQPIVVNVYQFHLHGHAPLQLLSMEQYQVKSIPLSEIYADEDFNCRGQINPMDVNELCKDIRSMGLQFPIAVQPASDVKGGLPKGYKYRVIAGHRRFKAYQVLQTTDSKYLEIPAMLKTGLSDADARVLNLTENLLREDLNIMQEAYAIRGLKEAGIPREQVASRIQMSGGWVQVRFMLLDLPIEIQTDAAAGFLTQTQIREIYSLDTEVEQYAAVRRIKEAKLRNEKIGKVSKARKISPKAKKERSAEQMTELSELLAKTLGYGLYTRVLAWASGYISTDDLYNDIAVEAGCQGKHFYRPAE